MPDDRMFEDTPLQKHCSYRGWEIAVVARGNIHDGEMHLSIIIGSLATGRQEKISGSVVLPSEAEVEVRNGWEQAKREVDRRIALGQR